MEGLKAGREEGGEMAKRVGIGEGSWERQCRSGQG
jgi:hypothetical protein